MEIYAMSMTCARLREVTGVHVWAPAPTLVMRSSETTGLGAGVTAGRGVVRTAPAAGAIQGTSVSTIATADQATALLPISDVVVFDGAAGIRSWSPPV